MAQTRDRLLRVDLTAGTVESERVPDRWRRRYLGGKGLGARYLYEELDPGVDPLGPDNALLVLLGPLSGYLPGDARYAAVTRSPLTGAFLDTYAGGSFPERLAGALDAHVGVLVTGRAPEPVRLVVADGDARVEPAETWGRDAVETCRAFPDAGVACIGPAGENEVAYATIASDEAEHHAGRGGAGAVMGAKRLKAVVARGELTVPADLAELRAAHERTYAETDTGRWMTASGTLETVDFADEAGALAANGWRDRSFDGADAVGIEAARAAATGRERDGPVPGGFRVETPVGESVPRGATAMSLGAVLGIDEFDAVATLGETCNRLGVDVISAGGAVAWAVRASEAGHLDRDLSFGDPAAVRDLLAEVVARRSRLGDALADGIAAAAARYDAPALVPTVKGMALPAYDPRGAPGMALAYATSDRGACHRRALPVEEEVFADWSPARTAAVVVAAQNGRSVLWSLVGDDFASAALDDLGAEYLAAVDRDVTPAELRAVGERVWTLTRLFNAREGFDRADDRLPAVLREPAGEDGAAVDEATFERMLDAYYAARGWSADGLPARTTLDRLDLTAVVDADTPVAADPLDHP
ncbi:MAG: aldehyde ferredoxin oxidoreductase family protein [Haloferacaceae archaeon]